METQSTTSVSSNSGTVKWNDGGPAAPIVIPIVFFLVLLTALICLLTKYVKKLWDRKRRSDIYEIVDLMEEERGVTENNTLKKGSEPSLSSIRFTGVKVHPEKENYLNTSGHLIDPDKDSVDALSNGRVSLRVEANVHDSSNDTNGSLAMDEEMEGDEDEGDVEEGANNMQTLPLRKKKKINAPLAATESDV